MRFLKQSTSVDVGVGPFLDESDGKTTETSLSITQADIRLKKNNGNWAQKAAAQTLSHEEAGWYELTLDATDTDTLGILLVAIHESGALPVWVEFHVVTANVYDSLFSTDVLDVSVTQWTGTNVASPDTAGYPKTTIKVGTGTGEVNLSSGKVPATLAVGDDWRKVYTNTASSGGAGNIVFDAGASSVDNFYFGVWVVILSGTGAGQARLISAYTGSSRTATVTPSFITNPDNTSVFAIVPAAAIGQVVSVGTVTTVTGLTPGNLDAAVSSRASQSSLDTVDDFLDTEVAAILAAVDTEVAAIKAKTDNLPSDPADESSIQAAIAALNNLSAAQVLTQVNAALDTAISELGVASPTATPTIRTALMLMYMALRNKVTVTSTAKKVHNDAGTSVAQKSLSDDGATYTEAEMA